MSIRKLRVLITPSIQRAADLRGIPVNLWMQGVLMQAALRDYVEARDILEGAGFANRSYRLEQERKWREPQPPKLKKGGPKRVVKLKADPAVVDKLARFEITQGYLTDDPPTAAD